MCVKIQDKLLEYVDNILLLGVTITSNFSWKQHVCEIISKAKSLLGFLYKVFRESGPYCLARLYKYIVLPHLDYCSCVWDPHQKLLFPRLKVFNSLCLCGVGKLVV